MMVETINWELPPSLVHTESAELVHFPSSFFLSLTLSVYPSDYCLISHPSYHIFYYRIPDY
jgi:hypothetical protein